MQSVTNMRLLREKPEDNEVCDSTPLLWKLRKLFEKVWKSVVDSGWRLSAFAVLGRIYKIHQAQTQHCSMIAA